MRHIQYPDDLESKFKFVTVASLRCMQLQKGAKQRLTSRSRKYTTVAQEEVLAGFVREMTEDEIKAAAELAMAPEPQEPQPETVPATE